MPGEDGAAGSLAGPSTRHEAGCINWRMRNAVIPQFPDSPCDSRCGIFWMKNLILAAKNERHGGTSGTTAVTLLVVPWRALSVSLALWLSSSLAL